MPHSNRSRLSPPLNPGAPSRPMAAHVQKAVAGAMQAKVAAPAAQGGRVMAPHVRAAIAVTQGVGPQAKMAAGASPERPVAAHVQRAVGGGTVQRSEWSFSTHPFGSQSGIMTGFSMDTEKPPRSTVTANEGTGEELSFRSNTSPTKVFQELFPDCDGHAEASFLERIKQEIAFSEVTSGTREAPIVAELTLSSSPCSSEFGTTTKKGDFAAGCTELLISAHHTLGLVIKTLVCVKLYKCTSKANTARSFRALAWLVESETVEKVVINEVPYKSWLTDNGIDPGDYPKIVIKSYRG